jgi:hypothetical protein
VLLVAVAAGGGVLLRIGSIVGHRDGC